VSDKVSETGQVAQRTIHITVPSGIEPERVDRYLGSHRDVGLSRTGIQKLIQTGLILLDGKTINVKHLVTGGESITISIPEEPPTILTGEDIPLDIVFEDDYLAVVNKPTGMVTHPGVGNRSGTLVNALIHHIGRLAEGKAPHRPGIVHRLDKDTSGLLVIARTDDVYNSLQEALKRREVTRTYLALVCGHMSEDEGTIDLPIGRSLKDRKKMSVTHVDSREAVTRYRVVDRFRSYDLLDVNLLTGRTHQIRVHFSHLGHPVFGDGDYGGREKWHRGLFGPERPLAKKLLDAISHQALHARKLEFVHPVTTQPMSFEAPPPGDFQTVLDILIAEGY
jgi:23S rRNA pseudouridine1911/1915/1917 synthase